MSDHIEELDNDDEYLLYQNLVEADPDAYEEDEEIEEQRKTNNIKPSSLNVKNQSQVSNTSKIEPSSKQIKSSAKQIPSKFVLRPILLKYIDQIQQMYLQEKTPHQIQQTLKVPSLIEVQSILKDKINTFLNIIFESSHCYTEDQVQKLRPQVDKKIQRLSNELLNPLPTKFIEEVQFMNFLKLMQYHKEGRRSEKISKKCNAFFNLFFRKMKFKGITHTEGNVIDMNERDKQNNEQDDEKSHSSGEEYGNQNKNGRNKGPSKWSKYKDKYKESLVTEKIMEQASSALIREIRAQKNPNEESNSIEKGSTSQIKSQISLIEKNKFFQWNFDKEYAFINLLFESLVQRYKASRCIKSIYKSFSDKYELVTEEVISSERLIEKLQSMYSISSQKFIRRVKFMTIKEGLDTDHNSQKTSQTNKSKQSHKSKKKKRICSIIQVERMLEEESDKKGLTKEDEYYFNKIKEKLKALDMKQIYFSSHRNDPCFQEWKFMLEFIRDFYFSVLEDMKFEYLLEIVKRLMQMSERNKNKNISQLGIPTDGQEDSSEEDDDRYDRQRRQKQSQREMLEKLPKSSFSFTLSKISKSKEVDERGTQHQRSENKIKLEQKTNNDSDFMSIDEIIKRTSNQNQVTQRGSTLPKDKSLRAKSFSQGDVIKIQAEKETFCKNNDKTKVVNGNGKQMESKKVDETQQRKRQLPSQISPTNQPLKKVKPNEDLRERNQPQNYQSKSVFKKKETQIPSSFYGVADSSTNQVISRNQRPSGENCFIQQQENGKPSNIRSVKDKNRIESISHVQDEYSVEEIQDQKVHQNQNNGQQQNLEENEDQDSSIEYSEEIFQRMYQNFAMRKKEEKEQLINGISQFDSVEGIEIIKRELLKIKAMDQGNLSAEFSFLDEGKDQGDSTGEQTEKKVLVKKKALSRQLAALLGLPYERDNKSSSQLQARRSKN